MDKTIQFMFQYLKNKRELTTEWRMAASYCYKHKFKISLPTWVYIPGNFLVLSHVRDLYTYVFCNMEFLH